MVNRRGLRRTDIRIADLITDGPVSESPSPGNNVILTLDLDVQRIVERALRSVRSAAAVVVDVETGRILAISSKPAFDPNMMSGGLSPENIARVLSDRLRPFRDKALSDTFNPGSTFKAITATAGLEEKVIVPEDKVKCGGYIQVGRRRFRCTKAHKTVNLYDAIVQSCNVFFYDLGGRPGMMNRMAKYAADFGLGAPSGLGLNGEQAGFIPTEEWHRARALVDKKNEGFVVGHALNTAIGEGAVRVTVLQMALLYALARHGGQRSSQRNLHRAVRVSDDRFRKRSRALRPGVVPRAARLGTFLFQRRHGHGRTGRSGPQARKASGARPAPEWPGSNLRNVFDQRQNAGCRANQSA